MKDNAAATHRQSGLVTSAYRSPWWARNRHVQTVWPKWFGRSKPVPLTWEDLALPDGDILELAWTPRPRQPRALVAIFHGLEGGADSHYARALMATLAAQGVWAVVMHFRGCGRTPNRLPRAYHSGETGDALYLASVLTSRVPDLPLLGVGFSLGGNMLLKLQGEEGQQSPFCATVAVSPPLCLAACADAINQGFSRRYQGYLLTSMKRGVLQKLNRGIYPPSTGLTQERVEGMQSFREFDQHITAPLHGFKDADDYYQRASAMGYLAHISTPTLILHSADDPFMDSRVIPAPDQLSSSVRMELSQHGGHVGFVQGAPWRVSSWLPDRIMAFIHQQLQENECAHSHR